MNWHFVVFTPDQIAILDHAKLEDEFELMYLSAGMPRGMALFGVKNFPVHPVFYFSPETQRYAPRLLESYGAMPCREPSPLDIVMVGGDPSLLTSMFSSAVSPSYDYHNRGISTPF